MATSMHESDDGSEEHDDESGDESVRRRRKPKRGYVFPPEAGGDVGTYRRRSHSHGSRRKRRSHRRHTPLTGFELVLGFSVVWLVLVCFVLLLELSSDEPFFFVRYLDVQRIESGSWVIGDRAYLPDGRVVELNSAEGAQAAANAVTPEQVVSSPQPQISWMRMLLVILAGPGLVFGLRLAFVRVFRRQREEE